jgi:hypothetical protein
MAQRSASPLAAGEIWQRRFYMHRNPVKRGLVIQPEQWAWSRFRNYAFGEAGPVRINRLPGA